MLTYRFETSSLRIPERTRIRHVYLNLQMHEHGFDDGLFAARAQEQMHSPNIIAMCHSVAPSLPTTHEPVNDQRLPPIASFWIPLMF